MESIHSAQEYYDQSFCKLDLVGAEFNKIEFEECQFSDCDFSQVKFSGCKFINCEFVRCNLSLVQMPNSSVFGLNCVECKLVGVDWTRLNWPSYHVDFELRFTSCILNDSSFFGLALNSLDMRECKLHDVDFREGDFQHSSMTYCDFSHSLFMRTNLCCVDFTESTDYAINVLENQIKQAKFSRYEALNLLECLGIELVD